MPHWVSGRVEVVWDWSLEEENQIWAGVIDLHRFNFYGDDIPDILFGLTKHPCDNPYFANRGTPHDCCKYVADEVKRNEEFIKQYGEGDFGHTYALWSEILPHLDEVKEARDIIKWQPIFSMMEILCQSTFEPEWIRFVAWGNW